LPFAKGKKEFGYRNKPISTNTKDKNDILKENFAFHLNKSTETCSQTVSE
jgi:hypothetical protein